MTKISVITPVFNEEKNIHPFLERIIPELERIGSYELIFAIDPCDDKTEQTIAQIGKKNKSIKSLTFSRRIGQPAAVIAGILNCAGETCVVIDVDLQDPPELIFEMYTKMKTGYDVVYAKRKTRKGETFVKKIVTYIGYFIINKASEVDIPRNTGDFRIMSRRVVEELRRMPESHGFLRGLVALVGFNQGFVYFDRDERAFGTGNYNRYLGSLKIGFNGLVGFSSFLLSLTLLLGLALAMVAFLGAFAVFVSKVFFATNYPVGTPTIIISVLLMGGIQMIGIGILGEYISRIYDEVKKRPRFIIDRSMNMDNICDKGDRF